MAEPSRYTPEQLSILLRIAAGKLGRDPVKLQEELQNGRLDGLLQSLGADREKVNALLSDQVAAAPLPGLRPGSGPPAGGPLTRPPAGGGARGGRLTRAPRSLS